MRQNTFTTEKDNGSAGKSTACNSIFSCPECLNAAGCGWCVSNRGISCQLEYERDVACGGGDWVGVGSSCPNRLFDGSSTLSKHETSAIEGGFGTDKSVGRFPIPKQYVLGNFKKPESGGIPVYERPELSEDVVNGMLNDPTDGYLRNGKKVPK